MRKQLFAKIGCVTSFWFCWIKKWILLCFTFGSRHTGLQSGWRFPGKRKLRGKNVYLPISQQVVPGGCWKLLRDMQLLWSIADCLSHPQFNKRIHTQKQSSQYVDFSIVRLFFAFFQREHSLFLVCISLFRVFGMCLQTSRRDPCYLYSAAAICWPPKQ